MNDSTNSSGHHGAGNSCCCSGSLTSRVQFSDGCFQHPVSSGCSDHHQEAAGIRNLLFWLSAEESFVLRFVDVGSQGGTVSQNRKKRQKSNPYRTELDLQNVHKQEPVYPLPRLHHLANLGERLRAAAKRPQGRKGPGHGRSRGQGSFRNEFSRRNCHYTHLV